MGEVNDEGPSERTVGGNTDLDKHITIIIPFLELFMFSL